MSDLESEYRELSANAVTAIKAAGGCDHQARVTALLIRQDLAERRDEQLAAAAAHNGAVEQMTLCRNECGTLSPYRHADPPAPIPAAELEVVSLWGWLRRKLSGRRGTVGG